MELILDYEDYKVWYDDKHSNYYVIENNTPTRIVPIAKLIYDINTDIYTECIDVLLKTFDSDYAGEQVTDNEITYWLFKKPENI